MFFVWKNKPKTEIICFRLQPHHSSETPGVLLSHTTFDNSFRHLDLLADRKWLLKTCFNLFK
jgi:hypothetical protein